MPKEYVDDVWGDAGRLLSKALAVSPDTHSLESLRQEIHAGIRELWVAYDDGELYAACTTRITKTPKVKILNVDWLGGKKLESWMEDAIEVLESYAYDTGCDVIDVVGRRGWALLRKYGWKDDATIYRKKLNG